MVYDDDGRLAQESQSNDRGREREREEEEEEGVEQGERSRRPAIHRGSDACPRIAAIHSLP